MTRPSKLLGIVSAMTKHLSRPMTIKIRTGWADNEPTAHKLVPQIQSSAFARGGRIAAIMIHGRSRQQRYHRLANWEYIAQAAKSQNTELPLIPVIGNGDILSWDDWREHQTLLATNMEDEYKEQLGLCSCAMIGRGALIKPWIPTEIKESRFVDISATERFDMLKRFVHYGYEHWGSDQQGLSTTRRFLLEWLSYLHRYVPSGLVEYERPQKINQRVPNFMARDDLETLLSSSNSNDWVKISELLMGKVSEDFVFLPKHKSSSSSNDAPVQG